MSWVRIDDEFYDHPKFIKAGPLGVALWVTALAWANRNLTDGHIPRSQIRRLLDFDGVAWRMWTGDLVGGGEDADPIAIADHLVDCDIFEDADDGGYRIHHYLKFQPSRRQVEAERKRISTVRSAAGKRSGEARRAATTGEQPGEQPSNTPGTKRRTKREHTAQQTVSPNPNPNKDLSLQSETPTGARNTPTDNAGWGDINPREAQLQTERIVERCGPRSLDRARQAVLAAQAHLADHVIDERIGHCLTAGAKSVGYFETALTNEIGEAR